MKIKKDSWTIVFIGKWNKYILSPSWSAENIYKEKGLDVEVALGAGLPLRYSSKESKIRMIPEGNRVTFVALETTDGCLAQMEELALTLVERLPDTPVSAFGVNFEFTDNIKEMSFPDIFDISDNSSLNEIGCNFLSSSITRKLIVEDRTLNLTISREGDEITFAFNFHYETKDAGAITPKLKDSVVKNKNIAEDFLRRVYNLKNDIQEKTA